MLALASIALTIPAAAQSEFITFPTTDADDFPVESRFSADGGRLLINHRESESITRLDLATGVVDARLTLPTRDHRLSRPGSNGDLVVRSRSDEVIHVVDTQTMQVRASYPIGGADSPLRILTNGVGDLAVLDFGSRFESMDLATGQILAAGTLHPPGMGAPSLPTAFIADDDRTLVTLRRRMGMPAVLRTVDLVTGVAGPSTVTPFSSFSIEGFTQSGDRSRIALAVELSNPQRTTVRTYDSVTLAPVASGSFESSGFTAGLSLTSDGSEAYFRSFGSLYRFPIDGTAQTPRSPGVLALESYDLERYYVSADDSRILLLTPDGTTVVVDQSGAEVDREYLYNIKLSEPAISPASNDFAIRHPNDRIQVYDAGVGELTIDTNTGFGLEIDGTFCLVPLGSDHVAAVSRGSDNLVMVDLDEGAPVAIVPTVERPRDAVAVDPDRFVVAGRAGEVALVDATDRTAPVELARIDLGTTIAELAYDPVRGRLLARVQELRETSLVVIDVAPSGLSVASSVRSGQPWVFLESFASQTGRTLAIDGAGDLAYVFAPRTGEVEVFDLSTSPPTTIQSVTGSPEHDRIPGTILLAPDRRSLYAWSLRGEGGTTSDGVLQAFDTPIATGSGLASRWVHDSVGNGDTSSNSPTIGLTESGAQVVADFHSDVSLGEGISAFDSITGALLDSYVTGDADHIAIERGRLFVVSIFDGVFFSRFDGSAWREPFHVPRESVSPTFFGYHEIVPLPERGVAVLAATDAGTGGPSTPRVNGLWVVDLRTPTFACEQGQPNATGRRTSIELDGSAFAGDELVVRVGNLQPQSMFGMLVVSDQLGTPTSVGLGEICLGGNIGRLTTQVQLANAAGRQEFTLDTSAIPTSVGVQSVAAGATLAFQGWHRDVGPMGQATSNTSPAVLATFR